MAEANAEEGNGIDECTNNRDLVAEGGGVAGAIRQEHAVRAQIESGIIFGLSAALKGDITLEQGRVQQTNFNSYEVLRMPEAPKIEITLVSSREKPGGIGEPATALIAPAVANALFAATGKRVRQLPLSAETIARA